MYAPSPSYNLQFNLHIKLHFLQSHSGVDIVYFLTRGEGGGSLENTSIKKMGGNIFEKCSDI